MSLFRWKIWVIGVFLVVIWLGLKKNIRLEWNVFSVSVVVVFVYISVVSRMLRWCCLCVIGCCCVDGRGWCGWLCVSGG